MALPNDQPVAVFRSLPAFMGARSIGGISAAELGHIADLIIYPNAVAVILKRWGPSRIEDGVVLVQTEGPVHLRTRRFPPWLTTIVWVRQQDQLVRLDFGPWQRRHLRAVLTATGFGLREDRVSLKKGSTYFEE